MSENGEHDRGKSHDPNEILYVIRAVRAYSGDFDGMHMYSDSSCIS